MAEEKHATIQWRSRVVGSGKIKASQVTPHPDNPRKHPVYQREAVAASFGELGQVAPILINQRNGYLVDGEERAWLALDQPGDVELDVIYVDLDEDEHLKALAYLDATGALAQYDPERLDRVLQEVNSDSPALQKMLGDIVGKISSLSASEGAVGKSPDEHLDTYLNATIKQVVLLFSNEQYDTVIKSLALLRKVMDVETNTEVFLELLEFYEAHTGNAQGD